MEKDFVIHMKLSTVTSLALTIGCILVTVTGFAYSASNMAEKAEKRAEEVKQHSDDLEQRVRANEHMVVSIKKDIDHISDSQDEIKKDVKKTLTNIERTVKRRNVSSR